MGRTKIYKTDKQKSKAQNEWNKKWVKKSMTALTFRFHNVYDKEVLEYVKKQVNKTDYIRQLIIQDMNKYNKE